MGLADEFEAIGTKAAPSQSQSYYSPKQPASSLAQQFESTPVTGTKTYANIIPPDLDVVGKMSNYEKFMAGAGKAVYDMGRGIRQLGAEAGGKLGLVSDQSLANIQADIDQAKQDEADLMGTKAGIAGDIGGTLATFLIPAGGLAKGAEAVNAARTANILRAIAAPTTYGSAALSGATMGALRPVASDESRAANIGVGALSSVVGNAAVNAISRAANPLAGIISDAWRRYNPQAISDVLPMAEQAINKEAAARGIDMSALPESVTNSVREKVAGAIGAGKTIDIPALIRQAQFDALNMRSTLGQITRDPMQYAKEMNLRGIQGTGEPITNILNSQSAGLVDALNKAGAAEAPGQFAVSQKVIDDLLSKDEAMKSAINAAYEGARNSAGRYANLNTKAFSEAANSALDEGQQGRFLRPEIKGLLNDISSGEIPLNVNTATQIDSVLSKLQRKADDAESGAIGVIRDALNKAPIDDELGAESMKAFQAARDLARQRFAAHEANPMMKAAVEGMEPDKMFNKFILNGTKKDLQNLSSIVSDDTKDALRSQMVDYLKSKALSGASDETGKFSQAAYNKAIKQVADKLPALFSKEEIGNLKMAGNVASYIQSAPAGSAVNTSNTSAQLINLLSGMAKPVTGLPYVSDFLINPLKAYGTRRFVNAAVNPQISAVSPEATNALSQYMAPFAVPASAETGRTTYRKMTQ